MPLLELLHGPFQDSLVAASLLPKGKRNHYPIWIYICYLDYHFCKYNWFDSWSHILITDTWKSMFSELLSHQSVLYLTHARHIVRILLSYFVSITLYYSRINKNVGFEFVSITSSGTTGRHCGVVCLLRPSVDVTFVFGYMHLILVICWLCHDFLISLRVRAWLFSYVQVTVAILIVSSIFCWLHSMAVLPWDVQIRHPFAWFDPMNECYHIIVNYLWGLVWGTNTVSLTWKNSNIVFSNITP